LDVNKVVAFDASKIVTAEIIGLAIVLVAVVVVGVIIIVKLKPFKDFSDIKLGKVELKRSNDFAVLETILSKADAVEKRLGNVEGKLDEMDKRMDNMDKQQDALYGYTREAVVYSTKSIVWSDQGAPYPEVVEAGLKAIMLGQNGNVIERMKAVIIGQPGGLRLFRSELGKFEELHKDKLNDHFYSAIKEMTWGMK
jgi:hypothetical protein